MIFVCLTKQYWFLHTVILFIRVSLLFVQANRWQISLLDAFHLSKKYSYMIRLPFVYKIIKNWIGFDVLFGFTSASHTAKCHSWSKQFHFFNFFSFLCYFIKLVLCFIEFQIVRNKVFNIYRLNFRIWKNSQYYV